MKSHKDLLVWQKSMDLVVQVYHLTQKLPKEEMFNLTSQTQRCVVSIPSNIAEGSKRNHSKEYIHFMAIANGSASELETQLILISRLYANLTPDCDRLILQTQEILKMLHSLIEFLKHKSQLTTNN